MKTFTKIAVIIIVIMVISNLCLASLLVNHKERMMNEEASVKESIVDLHVGKNWYYASLLERYIVPEISFNKYLISNNLEHSDVLVLYYSSQGCNSCIEHSINSLKRKYSQYYNNAKIIIVVRDYNNTTALPEGNVIKLEGASLQIGTEDNLPEPCFFIYNDGIKNFYSPEQSLPSMTITYLDVVFSIYNFD